MTTTDTEADVEELKPCPKPWCGSNKAQVTRYKTKRTKFTVRCAVCLMHTPEYGTKAKAVAAWNNRTAPTQERELLREARKYVVSAKAVACAGGYDRACQIRSELVTRIDNVLNEGTR